MNSRMWLTLSAGMLTLGTLTSVSAALIGRLETAPDSGTFQAYYDDQLDITWAANANINGSDDWLNQMAWVEGLEIDGVAGWRLPNMDVNGDGVIVDCAVDQVACQDNEYGHLFNYGAGTTFGDGITVANPGPFSNIRFDPDIGGHYWSSTLFTTNPDGGAWYFGFGLGDQSVDPTFPLSIGNYAWAVRSGDVSTVPIPGAVWLFGSGLMGLLSLVRRKR